MSCYTILNHSLSAQPWAPPSSPRSRPAYTTNNDRNTTEQ